MVDICCSWNLLREPFRHIVSGCSCLGNAEYLHRQPSSQDHSSVTCFAVQSCGRGAVLQVPIPILDNRTIATNKSDSGHKSVGAPFNYCRCYYYP